MIEIKPEETLLAGQWMFEGGRVVGDDVCERIRLLIDSYLSKIANDVSGWNTLYVDPRDGRYWELIYPQGELQGGGPAQLRCLTTDEAEQRYGRLL
jgi:hypothetical protein